MANDVRHYIKQAFLKASCSRHQVQTCNGCGIYKEKLSIEICPAVDSKGIVALDDYFLIDYLIVFPRLALLLHHV